jgi:hypothetical protein
MHACVAYNFWFGVATANKMGDKDLMFCEEVAIHKAGEELVEHGTNTNTTCACTCSIIVIGSSAKYCHGCAGIRILSYLCLCPKDSQPVEMAAGNIIIIHYSEKELTTS